jgi:hypothetical protein
MEVKAAFGIMIYEFTVPSKYNAVLLVPVESAANVTPDPTVPSFMFPDPSTAAALPVFVKE